MKNFLGIIALAFLALGCGGSGTGPGASSPLVGNWDLSSQKLTQGGTTISTACPGSSGTFNCSTESISFNPNGLATITVNGISDIGSWQVTGTVLTLSLIHAFLTSTPVTNINIQTVNFSVNTVSKTLQVIVVGTSSLGPSTVELDFTQAPIS